MKNLLFLIILLIPSFLQAQEKKIKSSLLYSRVGYDAQAEKRIFIRSNDAAHKEAQFEILDKNNKVVLIGKPHYWGKKWNTNWWVIDFSSLQKDGTYTCQVKGFDSEILSSKPVKVQQNMLWDKTWETIAIDQLKARVKMRKKNATKFSPEHAEGGGWQDCGGYLREVNSHSTMLIGLLDLLEFSPERIPASEQQEIIQQMIIGLNYLAFCQDKAKELGRGNGAIIHEWPKHTNVITGDVVKGALCFARAAKVFSSAFPKKAKDCLKRAKRSFNWLDKNGPNHNCGGTNFSLKVLEDDGFEPIANGAPAGTKHPNEWKTRDLVMMSWTAFALAEAGEKKYQKKAVAYADQFIDLQIPKEQAEGKFYGHFRAFKGVDYSEKAWSHHEMGWDAGATFPHYIIPLFEMSKKWKNHPKSRKWNTAIQQFAYGYFLPACKANPFYLLPQGYYKNEGLLNFSGLWHGMNGTYGSAAALALELYSFTKDPEFQKIAIGNLQWIAGLNSGVLKNDRFISKSMIYGIGDEYIGSWTKIPGTICNGFESDGQFVFTEPKAEKDAPRVFTDEGWITHTGGWLSAISRLKYLPVK